MSTERDTGIADEVVSETYRQHSDERAPERLNRQILDLAASELEARGAPGRLSTRWSRPLAWAATIALSLAIVLELTELPGTPAEPAAGSLRDEFTPQDTGIIEDASNRARLRSGPNQQFGDGTAAKPSSDDHDDGNGNGNGADTADIPAAAKAPTGSPADTPAGAVAEPVLEEVFRRQTAAEERVDIGELETAVPEAERSDTRQKSANFSALIEKKELDARPHCDEAARETAATWLACIETLRRSGATSEAREEYEAFERKFAREAAEIEANK